ncbi:MAG: S9 family peptidase [Melioribacteraceae bacterium]|nr:S9 family peptidase [Melioribacteraceae bacterium]WKZ68825.1 MAG: S9 family peptidase [Melioribacteraceae bacterium]
MQKLFLFLLISLFSILQLSAQEKRAITIDDLWAMKRIGSFDVSPDNKTIAFDQTIYSFESNKGNTDIYLIDVDGNNLRPFKVTEVNESSPKFAPNGKLTFQRAGQIWIANHDGTEEEQLTDIYTGASGIVWSNDGSKFLFISSVWPECETQDCNKQKDEERANRGYDADIFDELFYRHWNDWRGPKRSHLFLMDLAKNEYYDLTQGITTDIPTIALGSSQDYAISPDGKEAAFVMNNSGKQAWNTNNDVFIVSLENLGKGKSPEYKKISVSEGNDNQPVYSPDGKYLAFRSMARAGFEADKQSLVLYNRETGELKNISENKDISFGQIVWSKDSKQIYFDASNEVNNSIYSIDIATGNVSSIYEKHVNSNLVLTNTGETIYFKQQRNNQPHEIFSINKDGSNLEKITSANAELLSQIEFGEFNTFWSEGAEGAKVQSIIVTPPFFNPNKKYPMIFLIHGGPQGAWTDDFHYRWNTQMFASRGYVVVAPNPRGSVGYGQQFTDEISQDWGGKVYTDLMNAYDYAIANYNFIDPQNTFAAGASYGGYMIAWVNGHTDRFNALVCHDGVFNLESMWGSTEELWFPEWEFGGTPWQNRELYQKWSPHMYAENMKTPTLIVHGALDFRVPETQAMEFFSTLQRLEVESKFLYYPDEYHFVVKPRNARLWWNTLYDWFEKYKKEN